MAMLKSGPVSSVYL